MTRDNEDLRRSEPRGAAVGAPPAAGATDDEVLGGGRTRVVHRRLLTAAAVGAAAVAAVMTLGILGPAAGDTGAAASRTTPSATPSASPTTSATPSPTTSVPASRRPTATRTDPPPSTPGPTPTATRRTGPPQAASSAPTPRSSPWSSTVTVAGRTHRARLEPVTDALGRPNYDLVVQTDGREAWRWRALYPSDGIKGRDRTDPNRFFVFTRSRFADLVSIDGKPVTTESIGHLRLVEPSLVDPGSTTERTFYVAVFRVPEPVGETGPYGPKGWVVQRVGGEPHDIND